MPHNYDLLTPLPSELAWGSAAGTGSGSAGGGGVGSGTATGSGSGAGWGGVNTGAGWAATGGSDGAASCTLGSVNINNTYHNK